MKIEQIENVTKVRLEWDNVDWEQWFMFRSDAHHDAVGNEIDLERKHLELAKKRNAIIVDVGDLFDAMQGRNDPRRSFEGIKPKHLTDSYFNSIVNDAVDFYEPYAHNWLVMGKGNHETSVTRNNGIDLTSMLAYGLNTKTGSHVQVGDYSGYVFVYLDGPQKLKLTIRYHHGYGGDAPVSKGVLQTARQGIWMPDADIVVNGHSHNAYVVPQERERVTNQGKVYLDYMMFLRTPGYLNNFLKGHGFEVEKIPSPKPRGCIWMNLHIGQRDRKTYAPHYHCYQDIV